MMISERIIRPTMKQIGYTSKSSRWIPILSHKNRKWGYNSLRITGIEREKSGKTLPGLMNFDFCCDIRMVKPRLDVSNMKE